MPRASRRVITLSGARGLLAALGCLAASAVVAATTRAAATTAASVAAPAPAPSPSPAQHPIEFIVGEAQKVQQSDVEAWKRYRFVRRTLREDLGDDGDVEETREMVFAVAPAGDGFEEILTRLDGRAPEEDEVERERRSGTFSKHYLTLMQGEGNSVEGGYSLAQLLHMSSYRMAGREKRDGVECYRLDFTPAAEGSGRSGIAGRVIDAMAGSLWITVEGFHLAAAHAATVRSIPIALSLSKVHDLDVTLEAMPVEGGVWLPKHIVMQTRARVLFFGLRRRYTYDYSDFAPQAAGQEAPETPP